MELKPPPTNVWADDRAVLRRSPIDGTGLFAGDDIEAGTVVQRRGGRLVTSIDLAVLIAAADVDPTPPFVDTITVHENAHLVMPSNSVVHFGNHSCDPTLWHAGPYELAARRDVRAGEELTVDYGTNSGADGFVMECHCGSADCGGRVTSDDWSDPGLRVATRLLEAIPRSPPPFGPAGRRERRMPHERMLGPAHESTGHIPPSRISPRAWSIRR